MNHKKRNEENLDIEKLKNAALIIIGPQDIDKEIMEIQYGFSFFPFSFLTWVNL